MNRKKAHSTAEIQSIRLLEGVLSDSQGVEFGQICVIICTSNANSKCEDRHSRSRRSPSRS